MGLYLWVFSRYLRLLVSECYGLFLPTQMREQVLELQKPCCCSFDAIPCREVLYDFNDRILCFCCSSATVFLTFGSSSEREMEFSGYFGQVSSGCLRKAGPCSHCSDFRNMSAVRPREAASAWLRALFTYRREATIRTARSQHHFQGLRLDGTSPQYLPSWPLVHIGNIVDNTM